MKIGAVYPQIELRGDPDAVRRIGTGLESLGYDYLLTYDHVLGAVHEGREPKLTGPYNEKHPFHDPFVMFAHLAALTRRLELVTGILILPQRQTALVARQATDVDLLSGGRLRLGVGIGWNHVEYDALGQDFRTRGAREEEQVQLLRKLWSEPLVSFDGRFDRIDRACINPRPRRPIPIWFGGFVEAAYRRAARLGDGFIFSAGVAERAVEGWNQIESALRAPGRAISLQPSCARRRAASAAVSPPGTRALPSLGVIARRLPEEHEPVHAGNGAEGREERDRKQESVEALDAPGLEHLFSPQRPDRPWGASYVARRLKLNAWIRSAAEAPAK